MMNNITTLVTNLKLNIYLTDTGEQAEKMFFDWLIKWQSTRKRAFVCNENLSIEIFH